MFKSVTSRVVSLIASAVLISAIIASSASALTFRPAPVPPPPCTPQISIAPSGQVQGTCFRASDTVLIAFSDTFGRSASETVPVSISGTFTAPLIYTGYGATESFQAWDFTTITYSNTITIGEPKIN
jgi:hypothetical protein